MAEIDREFAELAQTQHGLVLREQALALGASRKQIRHRIQRGSLVVIQGDVLRIGGVPETWSQQVMSACLRAGPLSAASHRTAAALHGLDGFRRRIIEISIPRGLFAGSEVQCHTIGDLLPENIVCIDSIAVTSIPRTLLDLGQVVSWKKVQYAVDNALRDGKCSIPDLEAELRTVRRRGRNGVKTLEKVLASAAGGDEVTTTLEREFLSLVQRSKLPKPEGQFPVTRLDGVPASIDFAWPDRLIAAETDGHGSHSTRQQRSWDAQRDNLLRLAGWTVLHFTYEDVMERPAYVISTLRRALKLAA